MKELQLSSGATLDRHYDKRSLAVLLSGREQFSPYWGGALARWTYEVYSRSEALQATVFGFPTSREGRYPLPHVTSPMWRACDFTSRIPLIRRYEDHLWLRALLPRLRNFDFVHIHNRPQWVPILRRFGYRGRIVLHLQNDHLGHWTPAMLDAFTPHVDAAVTCSEYLKSTFAPRSLLLAAKTRVVFNGVNTSLFFPREELREPQTILFVGRFHPEKGILQLVQAFAQVLAACPHAKLVIAGATGFGSHTRDGYVRQVESLTREITAEHPGSVSFAGYVHHDRDLPLLFQKATVFASPSLFQEPFGLVNSEAMACATPVVGSNRGGIPEVLGDAGVLIDPEDTKSFADALVSLLMNRQSASALGKAGYRRCQELFDWSVIAKHWDHFLGQLAGSRNARQFGAGAA